MSPDTAWEYRTQRVTAADHEAGNIRIPLRSTASTKSLFPKEKATVRVVLKETPTICSWDPKLGPDRERSGRLRVGRQLLAELVGIDEVLHVSRELDGTIVLR